MGGFASRYSKHYGGAGLSDATTEVCMSVGEGRAVSQGGRRAAFSESGCIIYTQAAAPRAQRQAAQTAALKSHDPIHAPPYKKLQEAGNPSVSFSDDGHRDIKAVVTERRHQLRRRMSRR
jgi:hypothetical protein